MADQPDAAMPTPEPADDDERDAINLRSLDLMETPRAWPPLLRIVDGSRVLDLEALAFDPGMPAHYKVLGMVLLMAIKDRASEVHFEPGRDEKADAAGPTNVMLYLVDGELLNLVPPPDYIAPALRRAVEEAAGLWTVRHRAAQLLRRLANRIEAEPPGLGWESGPLRLRVASRALDAALWTYPSERGRRLFVHLPAISAELSAEVHRTLRAHYGEAEGRPEPDTTAAPAEAP